MNSEIKKGKKKGSDVYVSQSWLYTKNNSDAIKTRLKCRRCKASSKSTVFIQAYNFPNNIQYEHEDENFEVKQRKNETNLKISTKSSATPLRQLYDQRVAKESVDITPFASLASKMIKNMMKKSAKNTT